VNDTRDTALDPLVGEWLTLPDVAEALGLELGKVRRLVADRHLVGVKRGEGRTFQVPAAFLVPAAAGEPADAGPAAATEGAHEVLGTLRGTVLVLADSGFSDEEILRWLFEVEPSLGEAPVEALRAGRRAAVRRVAQTLG
jgi:hypothetical protein